MGSDDTPFLGPPHGDRAAPLVTDRLHSPSMGCSSTVSKVRRRREAEREEKGAPLARPPQKRGPKPPSPPRPSHEPSNPEDPRLRAQHCWGGDGRSHTVHPTSRLHLWKPRPRRREGTTQGHRENWRQGQERQSRFPLPQARSSPASRPSGRQMGTGSQQTLPRRAHPRHMHALADTLTHIGVHQQCSNT